MLLRGNERFLNDRETDEKNERGRVKEREERQTDRRTCGVSKTFVAAT